MEQTINDNQIPQGEVQIERCESCRRHFPVTELYVLSNLAVHQDSRCCSECINDYHQSLI